MSIDKHYPFKEFEQCIKWEFSSRDDATPYVIIMPPPNVTGRLHLGHTLSSTEQDIAIRFKRMQGFCTTWIPGLDHAGIATQMMVEKMLAADGICRKKIGREKFLEHVWEWKEKYGGFILDQMRRLGFSADWDKLCFTMDPEICDTVRNAFIELHNRGFIYRDKRLVNWDPVLETALSDLEVINTEKDGTLWHIRYAIKEGGHIDIATTRPETMFADSAIAVNPSDPRYRNVIGKTAIIPLCEREIPIISDEYVDMEKGTGALKITPAHDHNDFEIGKRHGLEFIEVIGQNACLLEPAPAQFIGMHRDEARIEVLKVLHENASLLQEEKIRHAIPHSERSGTVIEPRLTHQWFIDMKKMAENAIDAVKSGKTKIAQKEWEKIYFDWLENIQPWCVSRQLWWGHRLPVWYGPDGSHFIAQNADEALSQARKKLGEHIGPDDLSQDEDVMDTWFSSGLWPLITLGWPTKKDNFKKHYPTDILFTGHDILFFWVARMMMLCIEFTGEAPFKNIYLHPIIRDECGKKMSKTKGNTVDPMDLVDEYGVDALRLSLALIATPTRHISFGIKNVESARNFITKLWNAVRFCTMNKVVIETKPPMNCSWPFNKWILAKVYETSAEVTKKLEDNSFHEASNHIYHFVKDIFCDWYIEFSKFAFQDDSLSDETRATMGFVLGTIAQLLHPFAPFVTEEIWKKMGRAELLAESPWPKHFSIENDGAVDFITGLISFIRRIRTILNIDWGTNMIVSSCSHMNFLHENKNILKSLTKMKDLCVGDDIGDGYISVPYYYAKISIPKPDSIEEDIVRIKNILSKKEKEASSLNARLSNKSFIENADEDVIEETRERFEMASKETADLLSIIQNVRA